YLEQAPQLPSGGVGCPTCFVPMTWADPEAQEEDQEQEEDDVIPEDFEAPAARGQLPAGRPT
ncbi:unnamed protein product, partial [Symbiodinium necroappetens]